MIVGVRILSTAVSISLRTYGKIVFLSLIKDSRKHALYRADSDRGLLTKYTVKYFLLFLVAVN